MDLHDMSVGIDRGIEWEVWWSARHSHVGFKKKKSIALGWTLAGRVDLEYGSASGPNP